MTPKKKEAVTNESIEAETNQNYNPGPLEENEHNQMDKPGPVEEKGDDAPPATPTHVAGKPTPKPKIPGLSEEERLKSERKKRKKERKKKKEDKIDSLLISPQSGLMKNDDKTDEFEFGDSKNDADDTEGDSDDEEGFEDSRETLSENEELSEATGLTTPSLKSVFARTLVAASASKPPSSSTPTSSKRSAKSPASEKDNKKARGRSKSLLPKKK